MSVPAASARERPLVLVADDFSDALELYQMSLELWGYDVVLAKDGAEALEAARQFQPDMILMDLSMPVLDGFSATEALRRDARTKDIPVIALTGHVMERDTLRARDAGCDTVVTKPCLPSDLVAKIRTMLPASKVQAE